MTQTMHAQPMQMRPAEGLFDLVLRFGIVLHSQGQPMSCVLCMAGV
jgi:hypothetical protein